VLTGIDAFSTYCYLLAGAEQRDEDTWGYYLLEASEQGLNPEYSIADAGKGLRAGHKAAWPEKPCHGDVFHILHQGRKLENYLARRASGATTRREKLEQKMNKAKKKRQGNRWSKKLTVARLAEQKAQQLASDVSILCDWLRNDLLALAGSHWSERRELWDFIVPELKQIETLCLHRIHPFRTALEKQKENLLAFAAVLDEKLTNISQRFNVSLYLVRKVCLLQEQNSQQTSYWSTDAH